MSERIKELAIPNRLEMLRNRSRLTMEEVSILTGYAVATVSRHENRTRSLSEEAIDKYSKLYKVKSHQLFIINQEDPEELERV